MVESPGPRVALRAGRLLPAVVALAVLGCARHDTTGPPPSGQYTVSLHAGDGQTGLAGSTLGAPLQVQVFGALTGLPASGVAVQWTVTGGSGASVSPPSSVSDSSGIAGTQMKLGAQAGSYQVTAAIASATGSSVVFHAEALNGAPTVTAVQPDTAAVGDTLLIHGSSFGDGTGLRVLFSGFPAQIQESTDTTVRAVVPACLPTRTVGVSVAVGSVASTAVTVAVSGSVGSSVSLAVGQVETVTNPDSLACLRFTPQASGRRFLLVVENATGVAGATMPFKLSALGGPAPGVASIAGGATQPTSRSGQATGAVVGQGSAEPGSGALLQARVASAPLPPQIAWENRLRQWEAEHITPENLLRPSPAPPGTPHIEAVPAVGSSRTFQVINQNSTFTTVTAVVKYVGTHGIIYQDVNAPAGGFSDADFQHFSDLYDDPIYDTDVSLFGDPSDLDNNGHVIILMTPAVNQLTPRGSQGFVAGFFYGNDLTTNTGSNRGEVFYSMVPDPGAKYGDARPTSLVLQVVPPTLAHEFMHMIHWNQRVLIRGGYGLGGLWFQEGLAHTAEDLVGQVFADRGDTATAHEFQGPDYTRAYYYLGTPNGSPDHTYDVSLLDENGFGSLEQRGEAWLIMKYLIGQAGNGLLKKMVQSTLSGTDNVSTYFGQPWPTIFNEWSVALYADDDPELADATVDPRYTFPTINLRKTIYSSTLGFALQPEQHAFSDFTILNALPASAPYFLIIDAGTSTQALSLAVAPLTSPSFATNSVPQLAILRLK